MHNLARIVQHEDTSISLTVFRGGKRYTVNLTSDEAMALSNKLQSFCKAQQNQPFYLLRK